MPKDDFFQLLNIELEPFIKPEILECLNIQAKSKLIDENVLKPSFLNSIECTECFETCTLDIFNVSNKLYIQCPSGYISKAREVKEEELNVYKFYIQTLLKKIALINSINFYINKINHNLLLFGEKEVNKINYKFFYSNQLFSHNKVNTSILYLTKEHYQLTERAFIITPSKIILNNSSIALLKDLGCQTTSLEELLQNDLFISEIGISNKNDINSLMNTYELVILDNDNVYLYQKKLNLSPKSFYLLEIIAKKGKQGLSISYDDCIECLWGNESYGSVDNLKQLYNHKSGINKACEKSGIEQESYKKLIKSENKSYKLMVKPEKVYIA